MLGQAHEAHAAYEKATLLTPLVDLNRRFPEVVSLASKYQHARVPGVVMGVAA